jgi:hypothetical protein
MCTELNDFRFGDNFAAIGSISDSHVGNYTICWLQKQKLRPAPEKAEMRIDSPVAYGTLLIRVLVRNNGSDLAHAQEITKSFNLTKAEGEPVFHDTKIPPLSLATFANVSTANIPEGVLALTARTLDACPPFNVTHPSSVVRELEAAGVYGGSYHSHSDVNLTASMNDALAAVSAATTTDFQELNNGWVQLVLQGMYGNHYLARAFVAINGYLALVKSETIYPSYTATHLSLGGGEAYLYTFSSKPPLGPTGFWSLTMYNTAGFLIGNPMSVYAVGDRSNLTYPDGSLVYETKSSTSNGSFQVLIQSASEPPPANWTQK